MKKALILAMALLMTFGAVRAEELSPARNYPYGIGAYVMAKAGVNAKNTPNGVQNGVLFNGIPDFGLTSYIPLAENGKLGISADLGYTTYAYDLKPTGNEDNRWSTYLHYLTIGPSLNISGFIVGFNFGLPLSGKITYNNSTTKDFDIESDDMAMVVELRLGGVIPVYSNANGRLTLNIEGGYALTGVAKNYQYGDKYNPQPAKVSLGMGYLFNLK